MVDLLTLAVLGLRGWHGWKRGTLLMAIALAALFVGYVGAALLFRPFGGYLSDTFGLSPLAAFPLAGMLVMGLITGSLRLAQATVERRRGMALREGVTPSRLDSAGGAAIGALWAGGLVLIVAWLVMGLNGALRIGPDISRSLTGRLASVVMHRVTYAVTKHQTGDQLVASAIALIAGQPAGGVDVVNTLMSNQNVRGLWTNPAMREALARGDVNALARSPMLHSLARDTQFVHAAAQLGLGRTGLGVLPGVDQLATSLVTQAGPLVRSMQTITTDPEVRRMLSSPQIERALQQGNLSALMNDPQFGRLMSRMLDGLRGTTTAHR